MSGYDFMFSSDLSRYKDQSTLFFRKSPSGLPERRAKKVICIAPGINFIYKLDEYKSELPYILAYKPRFFGHFFKLRKWWGVE